MLSTLRVQNELERLREEHLAMKLKEEEKSRRISSALLGSQGSMLVNAVFSAWREILGTLRMQNELEKLRGRAWLRKKYHRQRSTGSMRHRAETQSMYHCGESANVYVPARIISIDCTDWSIGYWSRTGMVAHEQMKIK